ncbi:MAG: ATP-binding cassette domain-containing protein, partial [Pseudomonadota bacterium]
MIVVEGLAKRFGEVVAVADVGFEAADGRITGLLGPNGAGKSTTLRMLYGALRPDRGRALVDGHDVALDPMGALARLGVLPH